MTEKIWLGMIALIIPLATAVLGYLALKRKATTADFTEMKAEIKAIRKSEARCLEKLSRIIDEFNEFRIQSVVTETEMSRLVSALTIQQMGAFGGRQPHS